MTGRAVRLDHLFVMVRGAEAGAASRALADDIAAAFERAGFREGPHRRHPGQGTENRCFRVGSFMFELLFVVCREEIEHPRTAPLALAARLDDPDASPFGFASRPEDAGMPRAPYPYLAYHPVYLPSDAAIDVADGVPVTEPLWFHLGFAMPGDPPSGPPPAPEHPNGVERLDALTLATPEPLGRRSRDIATGLGIALVDGVPAAHLTLRFDGGRRGERFAPDARLPVTIEL